MKDIYIEQSLKSHILRNALREAISSGEFNTGDRFPSEIELSAKYHISRGTIREAIACSRGIIIQNSRQRYICTKENARAINNSSDDTSFTYGRQK
jgi:DNA-binding GntR family transcriptional regulator